MGPIRQRKALSCVDCRRRKVKCDRTIPICVRCQKTGNAEKCTYVPHIGPSAAMPTPTDDSPEHRREELPEDIDSMTAPWDRAHPLNRARSNGVNTTDEQPKPQQSERKMLENLLPRVMELETYVRSAGSRPVSSEMVFGIGNPIGPGYDSARNPMSDFDKVMVRGKSFSTLYFGPSFSINLLLQFDELSKFVKEIIATVSGLSEAKQNMSIVRKSTKSLEKEAIPYDFRSLLKMVPSRAFSDKLVQYYLDCYETTYRIIHVPSFQREYEAFWEKPASATPDFVAQLLLAMSVVYCIVPGGPQGFVGRSSARRAVATRWITACESWVNEQSKKHMTLSHLQIRILIYISKKVNCVKVKRDWSESGHLHRIALGAGMHREPSFLCRKIDEFDCEMRRRLWFTIVELDLEATIDRGMTPSIDPMGWDCLPPRNIHDEEFDRDTERLPQSRPKTEWTRTAFLHYINEHLALRIEILGRVNSIRLGVDLETVMQYDSRLRKTIDEMPSWKRKEDELYLHANVVAQLQLYEFILVLHIPFASQTPNKARYLYSVASKRDAGLKVLKLYSLVSEIDRLHLSHARGDWGRASLAICHDIVCNLGDEATLNRDYTMKLVKKAVDVSAERVRSLGQGFHSFWIVTTAYALVRSKLNPDQPASVFAQEAANSVITIFEGTVLTNQTPMPPLNGMPEDEYATPLTLGGAPSISMDESLSGFGGMDGMNVMDPMFDFMNFDFSTLWNLDTYQDL